MMTPILLFAQNLEPQLWHWAAFGVFVLVMLTLDLTVFHRHNHEPTLRESAFWTLFWAAIALAFNGLIWYAAGHTKAVEFLTGYLIEWSLSMDNVFVFAVIFNFFRVPLKYQYRVLYWGILGAIVMRLTFVLAGAALIKQFDWIIWIFGAFLIYTGVKLSMHNDEVDPEHNILLRLGRKLLPVTPTMHEDKFFQRIDGRLFATPLFLVLLVIESTDVLFAVDSVPAIFGVTRDTFIVFTSNIFAILGLRALYFLLAGVMDMFRYLNYGLSAVLIFVGGKMIAEYWAPKLLNLDPNIHLLPSWASLVVVLSLLGISIAASIVAARRESRENHEHFVPGHDAHSSPIIDLSQQHPAELPGQREET